MNERILPDWLCKLVSAHFFMFINLVRGGGMCVFIDVKTKG